VRQITLLAMKAEVKKKEKDAQSRGEGLQGKSSLWKLPLRKPGKKRLLSARSALLQGKTNGRGGEKKTSGRKKRALLTDDRSAPQIPWVGGKLNGS